MLSALFALLSAVAAQDKADLKLELALDRSDPAVGEEIQAEVSLTNAGTADAEATPLVFDERALSFEVTFEAAGKPKTFAFGVVRPDPHVADRLAPPRVTLKPKKALSTIVRIPTLSAGPMSVTAVYRGAGKELRSSPANLKVQPKGDAGRLAAEVSTTQGDFRIDLLPEEAPNNVANFVSLAQRGFYDGLSFFRVVRGAWIQAGCPYDNGYGGPGWTVKQEAEAQTAVHEEGAVAMSGSMKSGHAGSIFFVSLTRHPANDKKYTIIGRVPKEQFGTLKTLGNVEVDKNTDKPVKDDVRIKSIKIVPVKG